ncbi:hypothetical protein CASFOL_017428 [Castilleja foliolosa]|uniref:Uncharacterized protein n=1 Tax=Castilleja foliolosa TaxID=1961234 RepID=A0ABD3DF21_9LAMI
MAAAQAIRRFGVEDWKSPKVILSQSPQNHFIPKSPKPISLKSPITNLNFPKPLIVDPALPGDNRRLCNLSGEKKRG